MKEIPSVGKYWHKRFQEAAAKYRFDEQIGLWSRHGLERRVTVFSRVFAGAVSRPKRVLDVGCGPGTYDRLLSQQGHTVVGVDYSVKVIARAAERSKGQGIEYLVADAYALPFAQGAFDVVISIGVLQTLDLPSVPCALAEMRRVLSASVGLLFLETMNRFSIKSPFDELRRLLPAIKPTDGSPAERFTRYNPYGMDRVLQGMGFKQVKLYGVFLFPPGLSFLERILDMVGGEGLLPLFLPLAHSFMIRSHLGDAA